MECIFIAKEEEVKQWIRDALKEYFELVKPTSIPNDFAEPLVSREEIASYLDNISLVTLHAWMNSGLPYHKQGGRVYFLKSEVMQYILRKGGGKMELKT